MNTEKLLKEVIAKIKPDEKLIKEMGEETGKIKKKLESGMKKQKIKGDVFLGGSFAKGTMIRKDKYDIDVYVRFQESKDMDKKFERLGKIFEARSSGELGPGERIHGSRDYYRIVRGKATWEIIPILKIKKPEEAENITDLSPFHVTYIQKKIKQNKKLGDEILLAKAFCYAQNVYGAESYINGISGYGVELLVCYYGSFVKMIKAISRTGDKIIIDGEKQYKSKNEILNMVNEAKLQSPIVLIDPTFKERNALAALSLETFEKFREACKSFLKHPSAAFFERKVFDEKNFKKIKGEFVKIGEKTNKQSGDIAGSKLNKFHRFLKREMEKYFIIKKEHFEYDDGKKGESYFIIESKREIIISGPPINSVENVVKFRKKHKNCYIKEQKVFAKEKGKNFRDFFREFKERNKISIKSMGIIGVE